MIGKAMLVFNGAQPSRANARSYVLRSAVLVTAMVFAAGCHRSVLTDPEIIQQYGGNVSDSETLVLQASNWEKPDPASPNSAQGDLQLAEAIFRSEDYVTAARAFKEVADKHEDNSAVHERALFMRAESEYQLGHYAEARDLYEEFRKTFPGSKLIAPAMQRLFAISDTWLEDARHDVRRGRPASINRFINVDRDRKPLFDLDGHAIETLKYVRENDPNGPLADDSLIMAAGYHFTMGNYTDAESLTDQLIHSYPHSEHQAQAHLINAESKIQAYKGAGYDARKLEEARRTLRAAATQFPDELESDRQRIMRQLEEIRQEQAKAQFEVGEWYRRMGDRLPKDADKYFAGARLYYRYVQQGFPGTKWAERAGERLADLPPPAPVGESESVVPPEGEVRERMGNP